MKTLMILHSSFILLSCILVMLSYDIFVMASILLFLAGLFVVSYIVGKVYFYSLKQVLIFMVIMSGFLVFVIGYLCIILPVIVVAVSILDVFFILQAVFWPLALRPILMCSNSGNHVNKRYSAFILSIVAAFLSLFVGYQVIYGAIYLVFCIMMVVY